MDSSSPKNNWSKRLIFPYYESVTLILTVPCLQCLQWSAIDNTSGANGRSGLSDQDNDSFFQPLPLITITTSPGTGSEVTSGAQILVDESAIRRRRLTIGRSDVGLQLPSPYIAIVDPLLLDGKPEENTKVGCLIALAGCLEGLVACKGFFPDMLCHQVIVERGMSWVCTAISNAHDRTSPNFQGLQGALRVLAHPSKHRFTLGDYEAFNFASIAAGLSR